MEAMFDHGISQAIRVLAAYLLAIPVALEREKSTRIMGLRTFPLVAVASCRYVLIARTVASGNEEALARVIQGLMAGIGFIGGGALLKHGASVRGMATGGERMDDRSARRDWLAVILAAVNYATLRFLKGAEETEERDREAERSGPEGD